MALKDELKDIGRESAEQALQELGKPSVQKRIFLWFRDVWTKDGRKRIQARRAGS
jgi:hypothetical protein